MNPVEFAAKWQALAPRTTEKAAYQEHFRDLCALVGQPTPSSDTTGQGSAFEKHVQKVGTEDSGFADVFKRGHFAMASAGARVSAKLSRFLEANNFPQPSWRWPPGERHFILAAR